jgi:L-glyceraldehyde 3-phosphate reductase
MFDRTIERSGLLYTLDEIGAGCIVFSPLAQGLLTDRYLGGVPKDSRAAVGEHLKASTITDTYLERVRGLSAIAEARGQTLAQMALLWTLRNPGVTSALIGASSVKQLEDNLAAIHGPEFEPEELAAIDVFAVHGTESQRELLSDIGWCSTSHANQFTKRGLVDIGRMSPCRPDGLKLSEVVIDQGG